MGRPRKSHTDLARRIVEMIRAENLRPGTHVREQPLADRFGISRTPVRAALGILAGKGVLDYVPNQGYTLALGADEIEPGGLDLPQTEEDRLFHAISRDRFANRLNGQITANELMRRYGVGRATAMRVLARMSEEGLIERGLGQSWHFGPALDSLDAYEESYRFRLLIEPAAILEPNFRPAPTRFARLRQRHEVLAAGEVFEIELRRVFEADADFHEVVGACCGNRFLAQAIRQQTRLRRLTEYQSFASRHRLLESCREHLRILDAIESGNREQAAELMRLHIRASQDQRPRFSNRGVPPLARRVRG